MKEYIKTCVVCFLITAILIISDICNLSHILIYGFIIGVLTSIGISVGNFLYIKLYFFFLHKYHTGSLICYCYNFTDLIECLEKISKFNNEYNEIAEKLGIKNQEMKLSKVKITKDKTIFRFKVNYAVFAYIQKKSTNR